jgi:hypothetical protein
MLAGMMPGMWSFVPLMPPVMNAGQAQPAEGTGAIAPLTAAGPQAITQLDAAADKRSRMRKPPCR